MKIALRITRIMITAIVFLSSLSAMAQTFEVVNNNRSNLELSLRIDKFTLEDSNIEGVEGQHITLSGIFLPNEAGVPDLPVVSRYVAIPGGAAVVLNVKNKVTETFSNVDLMPAPVIPLDDDKAPIRYERNEEVYSTNAFYPAEPILASQPMKIRDVDVVLVSVSPFQYNPVTKELVVMRDLDLEVAFEGGNGIFGGDPRYRSAAWDHIIRDMVINESILPDADYYNFIREAVQNRDTGCEYLIITPDNPDFVALADSIKLFRNQQGILTDVVTVSECGGNNETAIRSYIQNAYNNWDIPVSAVLLLGDHNTDGTQGIVSYTMNNHPGDDNNPYISDNRYGDVNNDHLPDVVIGRITGRNYNEMYHMINKDLQYERHPCSDARFYDKPITAMGFQIERWFQLCSEIVNGFWEHELGKHPIRINAIYQGTPGSQWSTNGNTNDIINYFGPNGTGYIPANMSHLTDWEGSASMITQAINAGAFIIQHRDHGGEQVWGEPYYSVSNINSLANPNLTFVMSNNCLTGRFDYGGVNGTCFAEAFHRHQYGALGIIAATQVSYSFVNDVYVWGAYDHMWPDFMPTYGTQHPKAFILPAYANVAGKYFLRQSNWPNTPSVKEITYYLFHHHGDVYMNLYTEVPQNIEVSVIPTITAGMTQFQLTATEGSTICLSKGNEIVGLGTATGQAQSITISPQVPGEELLLTITKQDYYRYTRKISIIPNEGPYIIFSSCEVIDESGNNQLDFNENATLNVALHNVGMESIQNVDVVLTSDSPYVTINSSSTTYESFDANQIVNKNNAFAIKLTDDVPDQTKIVFHLTMTSGTHSYSDDFYLIANAPVFKISKFRITDADGNPTDRLFKGETSHVIFTVRNQGHSNSNYVNNYYNIDAPIISYEEPSITTEGIAANDSIDVTFVVTVLDHAPYGAILNHEMSVTSNGYNDDMTSTILLGNCTENFENEQLNPLFQWSNSSKPWVRDSNDPYEGNYCYTSTSTSSNASTLALGVRTEIEDVISFWYKGSENTNDKFYFIHNSTRYALTGNTWQRYEMPINAGSHVFKWSFSRNSGADTGSASIDLIQLPPMHVVITDVEEVAEIENNILVYPNPGYNELNIVVPENSFAELQIFDIQGRMILEKEIYNQVTTINTESLAPGMYFWKVGNETGKWIKSR